ncbi:lipopolysaccharide heptosyltransferase II [Syntrophotalea acetylenivorans]|uniref:lipopolysaccharide heptosyltransferase II n=2 Tax=Syntrophotalea acetylenivorans TaxID=1842532 RepID=A0A1L3GSV0_9BACT|nr:lipopolysaccharide heptosyltransferase II [Syntrophotalea acetylenivorans]
MVRSTNWVGDAVMTTPAMGNIRAAFPDAEIVVVANPLVSELFSFHPYCDRVIVFDKKGPHKGFAGLWKFSCELRQENFDLAILLQNAIEAALMATLAGIPRRAGYRTDARRLLLSHGVPVGPIEKKMHHTDYYQKMLQRLGIQGGDANLRLACTEEELDWAQEILGAGDWVAINPGAAYGSAKRWFPDRFAETADGLVAEYGVNIVLTGGPGEKEIGQDIAAAMSSKPLNLIGQTSVRQLMAVLASVRLLVSNDSGPMHVGAAFGVPIVAVFGPTDHTTTSPKADICRIIRKATDCAPCLLRQCPTDHRCMKAITAADVLVGVRDLLGDR